MKLNCGADVEEESVDCCDDSWAAAFWRREMCSMTPPWRARTPTVICWGATASTVIVSVPRRYVVFGGDGLSEVNGGTNVVIGS